MGQSVILACPESIELRSLAASVASAAWTLGAEIQLFPAQIQVVAAAWHVVLHELEDREAAANDYAANEDLPSGFRNSVVGMRFVVVRFDSYIHARVIVGAVAAVLTSARVGAWMDTDYGWVIPVQELVAELANPEWDWRRPVADDD